jgi:hypothetical protein
MQVLNVYHTILVPLNLRMERVGFYSHFSFKLELGYRLIVFPLFIVR